MKKYWIDANIILRYLLNDNDELSPKAKHVMDMADKGEITLLVSVITIAEVVWVLESFYEIAKSQIADTLSVFVSSRGIECEERDNVLLALEGHKSRNVDFIDAYLVQHALSSDAEKVITFDKKHFVRLGEKKIEPDVVLK